MKNLAKFITFKSWVFYIKIIFFPLLKYILIQNAENVYIHLFMFYGEFYFLIINLI